MLIESAFLTAFSLLGMEEGIRLMRHEHLSGDIIGPGGFLVFLSAVLFTGTTVYFFRTYKRRCGEVKTRGISLRFGPAILLLMVLGLYGAAVSMVSYAVGTALFFILAFKISGVKSWVRSLVLGLLVAMIFELVFSRVARIPFS